MEHRQKESLTSENEPNYVEINNSLTESTDHNALPSLCASKEKLLNQPSQREN